VSRRAVVISSPYVRKEQFMSNARDESAGSKLTYEDVDKLLEEDRIDEKSADFLDGLVAESTGEPLRPPRCPRPPAEEPKTRLTRRKVQELLEEEEIDQKSADLLFGLVDQFGGLPPNFGRSS
jgi:hypothetical protein